MAGQKRHLAQTRSGLSPIVGRLMDNKYQHDGHEYILTQHGFARDKEFALVEQSEQA